MKSDQSRRLCHGRSDGVRRSEGAPRTLAAADFVGPRVHGTGTSSIGHQHLQHHASELQLDGNKHFVGWVGGQEIRSTGHARSASRACGGWASGPVGRSVDGSLENVLPGLMTMGVWNVNVQLGPGTMGWECLLEDRGAPVTSTAPGWDQKPNSMCLLVHLSPSLRRSKQRFGCLFSSVRHPTHPAPSRRVPGAPVRWNHRRLESIPEIEAMGVEARSSLTLVEIAARSEDERRHGRRADGVGDIT